MSDKNYLMNPNMRFLRYSSVVFASLLTCPCMSQALRIETIEGPPWGFVGNDGKVTGMMYEIGNLVARKTGLSFKNTLAPYARTAVDIENGNVDIVLRFGNEHMARVAQPVAIIVSMPVILVGPSGTHYTSLSELRGKVVGFVRTSKYVEQFDSNTEIHKYAVNNYEQMARMLASRRLDAGIASNVGLYYGALMAGVKPAQLGEPLVLGANDFVLFFSKKTAKPETVNAVSEAVTKLKLNGEIQKIIDKYTDELAVKLPQS